MEGTNCEKRNSAANINFAQRQHCYTYTKVKRKVKVKFFVFGYRAMAV